jgi:hypothetical protein
MEIVRSLFQTGKRMEFHVTRQFCCLFGETIEFGPNDKRRIPEFSATECLINPSILVSKMFDENQHH